ncbi:tRNA pseudouridine(54/55) synthase Pus10 [Archaeoglobales archaeon ex4484_92]|nr:MAG: tRNA pseudouridine(54/55) synthase Pus10 [Archaeoglobales archaeon ex4484_92]
MRVCEYCYRILNEGELSEYCEVCCNSFSKIDFLVKTIVENLGKIEYESFSIGIKSRGSVRALSEILSPQRFEKVKKTFGKLISNKLEMVTSKRCVRNAADVQITIDFEDLSVEIKINPIYICGRYLKRIRNISQTRWICGICRGEGCEVCNFTGKKYVNSVEELISAQVVELFKAKDAILHGAGREDVDVRMLGNGRPFVLEVVEPKRRNLEIGRVEETVNVFTRGRVLVRDLKYCSSKDVRQIKEERFRKIYRAKIIFEKEIGRIELIQALKNLEGEIQQRTPTRVLHRRSDRVRIRKVYKTELLFHRKKIAVIEILAEAGLYIKELVSGDNGRTNPSLSSLLGVNSKVEKLDVIGIH